jgi:hypothetical protein
VPLPQNLTDGQNFFSRPIVLSVLPRSECIGGSADEPSLLPQDFADLEKKITLLSPSSELPERRRFPSDPISMGQRLTKVKKGDLRWTQLWQK